MEVTAVTKKRNHCLPPKRGQIKVKMIKIVASAIGLTGKKKKAGEEGGGGLSSNSIAPAATPPGHNSDTNSKH